jgi:hypothetical protein
VVQPISASHPLFHNKLRSMTPFCPDLQHPWVLTSASFTGDGVFEVTVSFSVRESPPETGQRHVSDILSYPTVQTKIMDAIFRFSNCFATYVREEYAACVSEGDRGEGKTFQRLLSSELLSMQRERVSDADAARLRHYRLVCADEVMDIVCRTAPTITRIPYRESQSPIAG